MNTCPHCLRQIAEFVQGYCPLCGVYRVILPEPVVEEVKDTKKKADSVDKEGV